MAKLLFNGNDTSTLGVELELGVVCRDSGHLAAGSDQILQHLDVSELPEGTHKCFKHELVQSCVEVISGVNGSVGEIRRDLTGKLRCLQRSAESLNYGFWWGGTHPLSLWQDQEITNDDRYQALVQLLQRMARRLVTFGMHVHVGVESGDKAVMICDRIMQYLPTLLAISTSSPYWQAADTGLDSYRSKVMEGLPTAGLPSLMRNWSEYVWLVNHMIDTGFINSIREIWWDVRPHHNFGTVEVRICDMPGHLDHVCGLTALVQCLVKSLSEEIEEGTYQFDCHPMMVRQNKWRAARYGLDARLIEAGDYHAYDVRASVANLVDQLRDVSQDLGCESELQYVREMIAQPGWSTRQRAVLSGGDDPRGAMRTLIDAGGFAGACQKV